MSKRSEEAALKAYPVNMTSLNYQDLIDLSGGKTEIDVNTYQRLFFQEGYEQAEKDTIERAVMWLERHADEYNGSESAFDHMEEEMITDFRKAMEDEE